MDEVLFLLTSGFDFCEPNFLEQRDLHCCPHESSSAAGSAGSPARAQARQTLQGRSPRKLPAGGALILAKSF